VKKRKGDDDGASPVQAIASAPKKTKPAAKPIDVAKEGVKSTPTRQNKEVAQTQTKLPQDASSKHDEPATESDSGSESDDEMLAEPEIPAKSSPFKNGSQKFTAVDSVTNAIENEPIFGSLSHTSSDGIDRISQAVDGTQVLTHNEYMAEPAAKTGKEISTVHDLKHLISSDQGRHLPSQGRPSSSYTLQKPGQMESLGQASPSPHGTEQTGSIQFNRSAGASDGRSFLHQPSLWSPFPQADQVVGRQFTPPVSHSSPTLTNNAHSLHSATIVVVFNVHVIGNNVATVRSMAIPTTISFDAFFGKTILSLRDGPLAIASATNNCEVKMPDGWKTTFNPREHDVGQIWASIMKKTDSLCAPGGPHMFEIVEVEFR